MHGASSLLSFLGFTDRREKFKADVVCPDLILGGPNLPGV